MSIEYPTASVVLALTAIAASPLLYILIPYVLVVAISTSHFVVLLSLAILNTFGKFAVQRLFCKSTALTITLILAIILGFNFAIPAMIFG